MLLSGEIEKLVLLVRKGMSVVWSLGAAKDQESLCVTRVWKGSD